MKSKTLNLVQMIVDTRFGFIGQEDMVTLLSDPALHNAKVLLRCDADRKVVRLIDAHDAIEAAGMSLRDVSFTASQCETFRQYA